MAEEYYKGHKLTTINIPELFKQLEEGGYFNPPKQDTINVKSMFEDLNKTDRKAIDSKLPKKQEFANAYSEEDDEIIKNLIAIETGGAKDRYTAKNPKSSAYGKYQLTKATYKWVAKETNKSLDYLKTPQGQEFAFRQFLLPKYKHSLKSLSLPINSANIYTIHQLGMGRAKRYFTGNLTSKDVSIMWENLPAKVKAVTPRTDKKKVLQRWNDLYRKRKHNQGV